MATILKKPLKKKVPVKIVPRVTAVTQLGTAGPHEVSSGLGTAASVPVVMQLVPDPLNPGSTKSPTAAVIEKPKTGLGKFIADNGGLVGIVGSLGSIVYSAKNGGKTPQPFDEDLDGNGSPDSDNFTILGLPPFAFAAVVLLLVVGLIIVLRKPSRG